MLRHDHMGVVRLNSPASALPLPAAKFFYELGDSKFLIRGGKFTVLEGDVPCERIALLEFPSRQAAEDWYNSPAYQKILPLRLNATECQFIVADGVE